MNTAGIHITLGPAYDDGFGSRSGQPIGAESTLRHMSTDMNSAVHRMTTAVHRIRCARICNGSYSLPDTVMNVLAPSCCDGPSYCDALAMVLVLVSYHCLAHP